MRYRRRGFRRKRSSIRRRRGRSVRGLRIGYRM